MSSPGDIIADMLDDIGMDHDEFARRLGEERGFVDRLIRGDERITPTLAVRLSLIIGSSPHYWLGKDDLTSLLERFDLKKHGGEFP